MGGIKHTVGTVENYVVLTISHAETGEPLLVQAWHGRHRQVWESMLVRDWRAKGLGDCLWGGDSDWGAAKDSEEVTFDFGEELCPGPLVAEVTRQILAEVDAAIEKLHGGR